MLTSSFFSGEAGVFGKLAAFGRYEFCDDLLAVCLRRRGDSRSSSETASCGQLSSPVRKTYSLGHRITFSLAELPGRRGVPAREQCSRRLGALDLDRPLFAHEKGHLAVAKLQLALIAREEGAAELEGLRGRVRL